MENKGTSYTNAGNLVAGQPMVLGGSLAYDPDELAAQTSRPQPVVSGGPARTSSSSAAPNGFGRFLRRFVVVVLIILALGGGVIWFIGSRSSEQNTATGGQTNTVEIPLSDLVTGGVSATGTRSVTINGPLTLNDTLTLTPQAQPVQAVAGQMYYDQTANQLAYYNGTEFVSLGGTQVVSLTSASAALTVVNDGAGNLTITSNAGGGAGTVTGPGGTAGRIAKFTGAQSIADSLLSEAGTAVTVSGDLTVTGSVGLGAPLSVVNGGTGAATVAVNGVVIGNGTAALTAVTAAGPGLCFLSTAGAPAFSACPGGVTDTFVQNGNSFGATAVLGTNDNNGLSLEVNNGVVMSLSATGAANFINTTNSTQGFNIENSAGGNLLTVDTTNSRAGISLGGNNVPTLTGTGLQIQGALKLSGSADTTLLDTYSTPLGSSLLSRVAIENENLSAGRSVIYLGLVSGAATGARGLTVLDARAVTHQPSIAVISPDENQIAGFSWDGSNSAFVIKNSASGSVGLDVAGTTRVAATTTGASVTGLLTVSSLGTADTSTALCRNTSNQIATCTGTTSAFIQNGNSFAAGAVLGTNDNNSLSFETNGTTVATFATNGSLLLQNTANSTTALNVKNSGAGNLFTVDTTNSRVGIALGGSNTPTLTNAGLQIQGALKLSGSDDTALLDTYLTPLGSSLLSRVAIENENLASGRSVMYLGLVAASAAGSRGLTVLDARTVVHAPSIGVISPDENEIAGFSWDGSNTAFLIKNSASGSVGLSVAGTTRLAATTTGATVTGNLLPDAAGVEDLGSSSLEFNQLYLGDNNGIKLGLDQDATIAYDEATDDRVEITGTNASLFLEDRLGLGVDARPIADNGGGTNATLTLTPASSYVTITCNDGNGCDITMGEGSAKDGDTLFIVNTGTNTVNFADTSGVSELNSTFAAGQYDSITMLYVGDRWVEIARSNN